MPRYEVIRRYGFTDAGVKLSTSNRADAITECERLNRDNGLGAYTWFIVWDHRTAQCICNNYGEVRRDGND